MAVKVPQKEKISGEEKNGERKGVGSVFHQRRANRGSTSIEERKQ